MPSLAQKGRNPNSGRTIVARSNQIQYGGTADQWYVNRKQEEGSRGCFQVFDAGPDGGEHSLRESVIRDAPDTKAVKFGLQLGSSISDHDANIPNSCVPKQSDAPLQRSHRPYGQQRFEPVHS